MKRNYVFKTVFAAIALTIGLSVSAQQKSLYLNFENATSSDFTVEGTNTADVTIETSSSLARSGSKYVKFNNFFSNTGATHYKYTPAYVVVSPTETVHMIIYFGSSDDATTASAGVTGDFATTPGMTSVATRDITSRRNGARLTSLSVDGNIYPRIRIKPGANLLNEIYVDDIVMYVHASTTTDIVAPLTATDFTVEAASKTIGWTGGTDALTGVQKTYVLRSTNTSATAPVLMPQVGYSVNGGADGANTIGDWTVVAVVDAAVVSYIDAAAATGTDYVYAVVHRDLAYNNSVALMSGTVNYTGTSLDRNSVADFAYITNANGIEFRSLKQGAELSIYSMTGAKVYGQIIENSNLSVNLSKGIYMVRVADKVSKVIVK